MMKNMKAVVLRKSKTMLGSMKLLRANRILNKDRVILEKAIVQRILIILIKRDQRARKAPLTRQRRE
jgi:hypothetical protein